MKDSISIIFAAIIGAFLIVILPLYSILDRQDSMSYNVVLTATTNFVDNVRNNGFIDKESYNKYLAKLATTANTYKVNLEVYRKILIKDVDENGEIIADSYIEEKELYNTQDIMEVIEAEKMGGIEYSNIKNNAYLLNENDEIYIRIHNTNITTGSMLYSLLASNTNTEVINITYGGVINKINWELYDKIKAESVLAPEVLISVPVNAYGSTNIMKVEKIEVEKETEDEIENEENTEVNEEIDYGTFVECSIGNAGELTGTTNAEFLCGDLLEAGKKYIYLYELNKQENKTIRVAVDLRRFDKIDIGDEYVEVSKLAERWNQNVENYIKKYIETEGFYAQKRITPRLNGNYYIFDIEFSNVTMSQIDYISGLGKIIINPGLGIDKYGTESLIGESVEIEFIDTDAANTVAISMPINWKKLLKTESLSESVILNNEIFANQEIAFLISYTGIKNAEDESDEDRDIRIIDAIRQKLEINDRNTSISTVEFLTPDDLKEKYDIDISTVSAGHVLVKFSYKSANKSKDNYLSLPNGWIETNLNPAYDPEDPEQEQQEQIYSVGAQSIRYEVLLDDESPLPPQLVIQGKKGKDGWYVKDDENKEITLLLMNSKNDQIKVDGSPKIGGSGVYLNTVEISGANSLDEQEITSKELTQNGIGYAIARAYDYIGNVIETEPLEIKIDTEKPAAPVIEVDGNMGKDGWYTSEVKINIIPGTDNVSGIDKTTYTILGANAISETKGTEYILHKNGQSTIIATTYDKAGNSTSTSMNVKIDTSEPPEAKITVIEGEKNLVTNEWYKTPVTLQISVESEDTISGLGISNYKITGASDVPTTWFEGNTTQITITKDGEHYITVNTYTQAGKSNTIEYVVYIDKDAPNMPIVTLNGTQGDNDWYRSNVNVAIKSNGDDDISGESMISYTITKNDKTSIEQEIFDNYIIPFYEEGEYILSIYTMDYALNKEKYDKIIKIDKTPPTSAEFVINGIKGKDGWYKEQDVYISYKNAEDNVSGTQSVILSHESITKNTIGTKVTLTAKDKAGNSVTKETTIKLDKSAPTAPVINLDKRPTGNEIVGAQIYKENVEVTVTPGQDYFIPGIDNLDKNTLEITMDSGKIVLLKETETMNYKIQQEGLITVTARAYDKAGNVTTATKIIWIEKDKPEKPKIASINGNAIGNTLNKEVIGKSNIINLGIDNLTVGNDVKIVLINQQTSEKTEIVKQATSNNILNIELIKKGTYSIKVTQTNIYGTESDESEGLYLYTYQ